MSHGLLAFLVVLKSMAAMLAYCTLQLLRLCIIGIVFPKGGNRAPSLSDVRLRWSFRDFRVASTENKVGLLHDYGLRGCDWVWEGGSGLY